MFAISTGQRMHNFQHSFRRVTSSAVAGLHAGPPSRSSTTPGRGSPSSRRKKKSNKQLIQKTPPFRQQLQLQEGCSSKTGTDPTTCCISQNHGQVNHCSATANINKTGTESSTTRDSRGAPSRILGSVGSFLAPANHHAGIVRCEEGGSSSSTAVPRSNEASTRRIYFHLSPPAPSGRGNINYTKTCSSSHGEAVQGPAGDIGNWRYRSGNFFPSAAQHDGQTNNLETGHCFISGVPSRSTLYTYKESEDSASGVRATNNQMNQAEFYRNNDAEDENSSRSGGFFNKGNSNFSFSPAITLLHGFRDSLTGAPQSSYDIKNQAAASRRKGSFQKKNHKSRSNTNRENVAEQDEVGSYQWHLSSAEDYYCHGLDGTSADVFAFAHTTTAGAQNPSASNNPFRGGSSTTSSGFKRKRATSRVNGTMDAEAGANDASYWSNRSAAGAVQHGEQFAFEGSAFGHASAAQARKLLQKKSSLFKKMGSGPRPPGTQRGSVDDYKNPDPAFVDDGSMNPDGAGGPIVKKTSKAHSSVKGLKGIPASFVGPGSAAAAAATRSTSPASPFGAGMGGSQQRGFLSATRPHLSINITRAHVVRENLQTFSSVYESSNIMLGEGAFGTVIKAIHRTTGIIRAAKQIPKNALEDQRLFENEVETLMALDHPHIVKLVEYFEEKDQYILIFELCQGPDLFDRIVDVITDRAEFDEVEAGRLLRHMLKAILCCHSHKIIHRDIKPENFMFSRADPRSSLKMIDLGLSELYKDDGFLGRSSTPIGTIAYMSPEMMVGERYDRQCDIWSLGVILWAMLMGEPLFTHECDKLCEEQILDLTFLRDELKKAEDKMTPEAHELLGRMLQRDPKLRITAAEALSHPFILKSYSPSDYADSSTTPSQVRSGSTQALFDRDMVAKMEHFVAQPALKRVGTFVFAHLCGTDAEDTRLSRLTFRQLDKQGLGMIKKEDMVSQLRQRGIDVPEDFGERVMPFLDSNSSTDIDFIEFLAATIDVKKVRKHEQILKGVFQLMDTSSTGVLSIEDMADLLSNNTLEQLEAMVLEVAPSGTMNYEEFKAMMLS